MKFKILFSFTHFCLLRYLFFQNKKTLRYKTNLLIFLLFLLLMKIQHIDISSTRTKIKWLIGHKLLLVVQYTHLLLIFGVALKACKTLANLETQKVAQQVDFCKSSLELLIFTLRTFLYAVFFQIPLKLTETHIFT